jgi:hypothetical protein
MTRSSDQADIGSVAVIPEWLNLRSGSGVITTPTLPIVHEVWIFANTGGSDEVQNFEWRGDGLDAGVGSIDCDWIGRQWILPRSCRSFGHLGEYR